MRPTCLLRQAVVFHRNAVGEKAVDHSVEQILQVVGVAGDGNDLVPVGRLDNEGVDARISIRVTGNHPEPKSLLRKRVEHLLDRPERVPSAGALGQDQNIGLGPIRFRNIRESAALFARGSARRDVGSAVGKRRQMLSPRHRRQRNFDPHDARQRPFDLHVEAGQDRHPVPVYRGTDKDPTDTSRREATAAGGVSGRFRSRRFRGLPGGDAANESDAASHDSKLRWRPALWSPANLRRGQGITIRTLLMTEIKCQREQRATACLQMAVRASRAGVIGPGSDDPCVRDAALASHAARRAHPRGARSSACGRRHRAR